MIDLQNVSVQFSGDYLFRDINLRINSKDRLSLVGANGAGKTTLLKIIYGIQQAETGKILKQKSISIGYLPQEIISHSGKPLFDEVKSSLVTINELAIREKEITELLANEITDDERDELIYQLGAIHHRQEDIGYYGIDAEIEKVLNGLGFKEAEFRKLTEEFSGGWQMRIALAKLLLANHNLLLLDEPTNHLDIDSLEWLTEYLQNFEGALVIISHDRRFVNRVTEKTVELYLHKVFFFNGNYEAFLKYKEERDTQLEHQYFLQQKKIKETEKFIERFRYKSTKARQVQSRVKQLEKIDLIELPDYEEEINLKFPEPPSSGVIPIELKNIKKAYGNNVVFDELNFQLDRNDKVAFIGPNGAGKSTLAKIIAGVIDFDSGKKILGHNTILSYYAQEVADNLDPEKDILQSVEDIGENKTIAQLRSILGSFLFSGDDVFKKIQVLSGGEKSRVALAKILLTKANLIVLDEPTNHLDYSSKLVLQKALIDFKGTLVLVSHDVDFLKPIVNKVFEIREKCVQFYSGGIEYYLDKRKENIEKQKTNESELTQPNYQQTRKEQKRNEALVRQQKYNATKDLIKEIATYEKQIAELESRISVLEKELSEETVYSNPVLAKEKNSDYVKSKNELDKVFNIWTDHTEKLEAINKSFESEEIKL
ncbi:MAG: ABC transporter ATP-binding protein [Ignavibacteriales bacterium]|nr:MAG: ABC transporter ATP-binding protein [Ignavibacteriales bacterium]